VTAAIRLAVIDDHPLFREGVGRILADLGFDVVAEGGSADDALRIAEQANCDVILMDISMPGGGLTALGEILRRHPHQKIVMLTVSELTDDVTQALNFGAKGYVLKGVDPKELAEVLRMVASGETYVWPTLSARVVSDLAARSVASAAKRPIDELTERERLVLDLVASGLSNKRIARQLDTHEKTIKHYMTRILAKLHMSNRTEAAVAFREATRNGA
jgi:two-component system, NarL family, nitrate/nitrite response regulator NarL